MQFLQFPLSRESVSIVLLEVKVVGFMNILSRPQRFQCNIVTCLSLFEVIDLSLKVLNFNEKIRPTSVF